MNQGPKLPYNVSKAAMITNPEGNGLILVGGWNANIGKPSNIILELKNNESTWEKLKATLHFGRQYPLIIPISKKQSKCGMNKSIM